jgi:hypothetical protein
MMGMVFQWKPEAHCKVDAQLAGEEMERIRTKANGRLTPQGLVDASRDPSAPLHPEFEWDDDEAAKAWRRNQASYMIRSITVLREAGAEDEAPIRAFVSVMREEDRSYTSIAHALSDEELRAQVVAQAWSELAAFRKRYAELKEFAQVFALLEARAA